MKVICCLLIWSSFVNYGFCLANEDMKANETAVKEYCEEECEQKCVPCHEVVECTQDQTDCGLGKPDPAFGGVCPAQPICVSSDYNCKSILIFTTFLLSRTTKQYNVKTK